MATHITPQDAEEICKRYIAAVEAGDLSAIDTLFTQDAIVRTPVSGHKPARAFYAYVFKAISDRKMKLLDVLVGIAAPSRVALHMAYTRTVIGSPPATIETIDIFELTDRFDQISAVNIVYDTAPVRTDFETPKAQIDG